MASAAGLLGKQFFSRDDGIDVFARRPGKPRGVVRRLHDGDPSAHDGVVCAAILRTEEMVAAGFRGTEPHGVVMAGDDVHFHAKRRNEKVVDDVLTGEHELDVAADGNVQFVDFSAAVGLLNFPHPLLADDINVQSVLGRMAVIDVNNRAPAKHGQGQNCGNHDPRDFQAHVAVNRNADFVLTLAVKFEEENHDRGGDGRGEKDGDEDQERHQRVHAGSEVGGLLGIKWQLRLHGLVGSLEFRSRGGNSAIAPAEN